MRRRKMSTGIALWEKRYASVGEVLKVMDQSEDEKLKIAAALCREYLVEKSNRETVRAWGTAGKLSIEAMQDATKAVVEEFLDEHGQEGFPGYLGDYTALRARHDCLWIHHLKDKLQIRP